jgi:hypothetical protein
MLERELFCMTPPPPALISRREAAARLQVHDSTITHYVQRGLLHVVERRPPQGQYYFRRDEVEALAQAKQHMNGNGHQAAPSSAMQVPTDVPQVNFAVMVGPALAKVNFLAK